jgi:hypothetical protein
MKLLSLLLLCVSLSAYSQKQNIQNIESIFGNEYTIHKNSEGFELIGNDYITVSDFQEYQNEVRDSLAFELIFLNIESDLDALNYLDLTNNERKNTNGSYRKKLRNEYSLNRNDEELRKDLYKNKLLEPLLTPLIVPFWKRQLQSAPYIFDDRNVFYSSPENEELYSILLNHWKIAQTSQHPNDLISVIAKTQLSFNVDAPAVGLSSQNIDGYFSWKKERIAALLKTNGIPLTIRTEGVEMNTNLDYSIQREDLIKQWGISNKDYQSFLNHVEDSLLREYLFFNITNDKEAFRYLDDEKYPFDFFYFSQLHGEPFGFDRIRNRYYHNLNYTSRIQKKTPEVKNLIKKFHNEVKNEEIPHIFIEMDAKKQMLNYSDVEYSNDYYHFKREDLYTLDSIKVNLSATSIKNKHDNIVSLLSYNEALAFYHWKYPINKSINKSDWKNYVFPSKEEFGLLKEGIVNDINVSIPIKAFSYKVILNN